MSYFGGKGGSGCETEFMIDLAEFRIGTTCRGVAVLAPGEGGIG